MREMAVLPADKTVPMYCPYCDSQAVIVVEVCDGYRCLKVKCPSCNREAFLAIPAIRSAMPQLQLIHRKHS
jgi:transposase-like protein